MVISLHISIENNIIPVNNYFCICFKKIYLFFQVLVVCFVRKKRLRKRYEEGTFNFFVFMFCEFRMIWCDSTKIDSATKQ